MNLPNVFISIFSSARSTNGIISKNIIKAVTNQLLRKLQLKNNSCQLNGYPNTKMHNKFAIKQYITQSTISRTICDHILFTPNQPLINKNRFTPQIDKLLIINPIPPPLKRLHLY